MKIISKVIRKIKSPGFKAPVLAFDNDFFLIILFYFDFIVIVALVAVFIAFFAYFFTLNL